MKTAIALGTFDGVHKGHAAVIKAAVKSGFTPIAVAFPESPRGIISGEKSIITTLAEKERLLKRLGIKKVHFLDFSALRDMSADEFLEYLKGEFSPAVISCGFNYRFGKNGAGDTKTIEQFCEKNGIRAIIVDAVTADDAVISSTRIRELLAEGEIESANGFLTEPFGFSGEIIHGDERGRTIGFPTVNQVYPKNKPKVKFGVYKSAVTVNGTQYAAITNIGVRPTFRNGLISAETHIIGFSGEIYGKIADVRLVRFIREERKFSCLNELKENIENDLKEARD